MGRDNTQEIEVLEGEGRRRGRWAIGPTQTEEGNWYWYGWEGRVCVAGPWVSKGRGEKWLERVASDEWGK